MPPLLFSDVGKEYVMLENANLPVTVLKGVGAKTGASFQKLEIETLQDLLWHFPRDYMRFGEPVKVADTRAGEECAVRIRLKTVSEVRYVRNLKILTVTGEDDTGQMELTFFNQAFLKKVLFAGKTYIFRGIIEIRGGGNAPQLRKMKAPRMFHEEDYRALAGQLQSIYPLTKGLTSKQISKAAAAGLKTASWLPDCFSERFLQESHLPSQEAAIRGIHFPRDEEEAQRARRRLAFEEFFFFLMLLRKNKELTESEANAFPMIETADPGRFIEGLPFRLTAGQKKAWKQILSDLTGDRCMNRLIQGDVGSGKTVVALLALLLAAANGYQGALMAPTEVLAAQHFQTVSEYIGSYGLCLRPVLLVGSMTAAEKRKAYEQIAEGSANLVIGTHALIQEKVQYHKLALVVTDEQHRFGVRQRQALAGKGLQPHILVMSATPIPRTLAIVLYGDLQITAIHDRPADRLPIKNCVVGDAYHPTAYKFIADQVSQGRQAYVICPQVSANEEAEDSELENVEEYCEKLRSVLPPRIRTEYLHGRMRPADKNRIMDAFSRRDIDVLVSTTVIEVGINVPNATVMMVENAERFGLAQLHQLRGRVGRGEHQSYCIFFTSKEDEKTRKRLEILEKSNDGFEIAQEDLRLRGPGELFGVRQSGEFAFRIADIYADADLLTLAGEEADRLLMDDPRLTKPEHQRLREEAAQYQKNSISFRSI